LAEARLLDLVSEMLGGDELKAVAVLKAPGQRAGIVLVKSIGLSGFDLNELLSSEDTSFLIPEPAVSVPQPERARKEQF
jgi:hypothetical protein